MIRSTILLLETWDRMIHVESINLESQEQLIVTVYKCKTKIRVNVRKTTTAELQAEFIPHYFFFFFAITFLRY